MTSTTPDSTTTYQTTTGYSTDYAATTTEVTTVSDGQSTLAETSQSSSTFDKTTTPQLTTGSTTTEKTTVMSTMTQYISPSTKVETTPGQSTTTTVSKEKSSTSFQSTPPSLRSSTAPTANKKLETIITLTNTPNDTVTRDDGSSPIIYPLIAVGVVVFLSCLAVTYRKLGKSHRQGIEEIDLMTSGTQISDKVNGYIERGRTEDDQSDEDDDQQRRLDLPITTTFDAESEVANSSALSTFTPGPGSLKRIEGRNLCEILAIKPGEVTEEESIDSEEEEEEDDDENDDDEEDDWSDFEALTGDRSDEENDSELDQNKSEDLLPKWV